VSHALGIPGTYPLLLATWLLPLFGALFLWAFGPNLRAAAAPIGSAFAGFSFLTALGSIGDGIRQSDGITGAHQALVSWMQGMNLGLLFDPLSLVWTLIITGVGFLIHVYSIGYLAGDRAIARFFAYLNFFLFSMLTLVLSDNFIGLLVGWGLVGLASYFLIGFWFEKPSAVAASRKAFVINVAGDAGIMYAIFVIFAKFGSVTYGDVFARVMHLDSTTLMTICVALFIGCAAKSAQVPFHTWLPDAMEGPTPVSALIHAATMVTAGVYLIARCHPIWSASPDAQELVGVIGAITALTGGILGVAQWDIKRILAYSTMSQIGYMIMGVGVGAYQAGVLHFLTHAFFKAQLFLGAGIIIHALSNEQDVRRMGGLFRKMPFAAAAMGTGTLAICGIWPLSGFFSKDAIIYGALEHGHPYLYLIGVATAGLTAFYMFRMYFIVFFGVSRSEIDPSDLGIRHPELAGTPHGMHAAHAEHETHAPAWLMNLPVGLLIIPTVFMGLIAIGGESSLWYRFLVPVFGEAHARAVHVAIDENTSSLVVMVLVLVGIGTAYLRYATPNALINAAERLRLETMRMPASFTHAFYFDDAIDALFVRGTQAFGRFCDHFVEHATIDGTVHETAYIVRWLGHLLRSMQTGFVRAYALMIVFGIALCAAYYAFAGVAAR
jgi:NADH-quinone oxidoreductase subunit L